MNTQFSQFLKNASEVLLDKETEILLALCCVLARGHLLIEDIPGTGKTTLVLTLAKLFGLKSSRIQFTNDLLPADILGSSIFDPQDRKFRFHSGPIFAELLLADELNRGTPKTQSALLQGMEEGKVTVDGITHPLPKPFVLIATQNPRQQIGTYPLPESQLDRFLMKIKMGYPNREAERELLRGVRRMEMVESLNAVFTPAQVTALQIDVDRIHASDAVVSYLQDIVASTRELKRGINGLSPRATIGYLQAAKAWAFLNGRKMVLPEDIQAVGISVMSHRLSPLEDLNGQLGIQSAQDILSHVSVDQT